MLNRTWPCIIHKFVFYHNGSLTVKHTNCLPYREGFGPWCYHGFPQARKCATFLLLHVTNRKPLSQSEHRTLVGTDLWFWWPCDLKLCFLFLFYRFWNLQFGFFCPFYRLSTYTTFPFSVLVVILPFWHRTPITPQSLSPPFSLHLCLSLCKCACDWWLCPLVDKSHFSLQL